MLIGNANRTVQKNLKATLVEKKLKYIAVMDMKKKCKIITFFEYLECLLFQFFNKVCATNIPINDVVYKEQSNQNHF